MEHDDACCLCGLEVCFPHNCVWVDELNGFTCDDCVTASFLRLENPGESLRRIQELSQESF